MLVELLAAAGAATDAKNKQGPGLPGAPEHHMGGRDIQWRWLIWHISV